MYVTVTDKKTGEVIFDFLHVLCVETFGGHKIKLWLQGDSAFDDSLEILKLDKNESLQVYRTVSDSYNSFVL